MKYSLQKFFHLRPTIRTHIEKHPERKTEDLLNELVTMTDCPIVVMAALMMLERPKDRKLKTCYKRLKEFYKAEVV